MSGGIIAGVREKPGELRVYVRAAERAAAGESFYDPGDRPAFSYPPAAVLATVPLVPLSDLARRWAWWSLNLALLGGVLAAVWGCVRPALGGNVTAAGRRNLWVWAGLTALLAGRFVLSPLAYQSHDLILLALLTASAVWWTARRDGLAGAAAGLAAAFKATPLLALPFFVLRRRWAAAGAMLLAGAAATAAPDALFPNPDGGPWAGTWFARFAAPVGLASAPDVAGAWESWNPLNQSLAGTLARLTHDPPAGAGRTAVTAWRAPPAAVKGLTLASQLAVLAWLAWCGRRPANRDAPADPFAAESPADSAAPPGGLTAGLRCLAELSLCLCGMLLLSPMSSTQHFCFLLPGVAVVAARLVLDRGDRRNLAAAAVLLTVGTLPARDLVGDAAAEWVRSAGGLTACAAVVLWANGRLLWLDRRAAGQTVGTGNVVDGRSAPAASTVPMQAGRPSGSTAAHSPESAATAAGRPPRRSAA